MQAADRMAEVFEVQQRQLAVADQIVQIFAAQQKQLAIADQMANLLAATANTGDIAALQQLAMQQESALQLADQSIAALAPFIQTTDVLAMLSEGQHRMIERAYSILLDPNECAAWYLELDPPRQPLVQNSPVPTAFARPNFPAPPIPGTSGNVRDEFRATWNRNPGMAWKALDQMGGRELVSMFGV